MTEGKSHGGLSEDEILVPFFTFGSAFSYENAKIKQDEIYSLANFIHIFESKFYLQSIINSLQISFISSIFELLIGLLASYSLFILAPSKICKFLFSLNTMISNFSGVPLAFAFIIVLGSNGVVNVFFEKFRHRAFC